MGLGGNSLACPSLIGNSRLHELATKASVVFVDETGRNPANDAIHRSFRKRGILRFHTLIGSFSCVQHPFCLYASI